MLYFRTRRNRRTRRGFTLVEALLALTLTGIVVAGIAMALRTGLNAADRIRERSDAHAEGRAVLDQLATDLSAAYLSGVNTEETLFRAEPPASAPSGEPFLAFTTLSYRRSRGAAAAEDEPRSDAVKVEYSLESPEGPDAGARLVRREQWLTETGAGITDTVCERVGSLRLRFFDGSDYQEDWSAAPETDPKLQVVEGREEASSPSTRKLPKAVEVILTTVETDRDKPRVYKTLIPLRADGVLPFESETVPPPPAPSGKGNGRSNGPNGPGGAPRAGGGQ